MDATRGTLLKTRCRGPDRAEAALQVSVLKSPPQWLVPANTQDTLDPDAPLIRPLERKEPCQSITSVHFHFGSHGRESHDYFHVRVIQLLSLNSDTPLYGGRIKARRNPRIHGVGEIVIRQGTL